MKELEQKVLLLENVHPGAAAKFREAGYTVAELAQGVEEEDVLSSKLAGISVVGIRSKTKVTARVIARASRLDAIGAFCIGTDQIDLERAPTEESPCSTRRTAARAAWWNLSSAKLFC